MVCYHLYLCKKGKQIFLLVFIFLNSVTFVCEPSLIPTFIRFSTQKGTFLTGSKSDEDPLIGVRVSRKQQTTKP